MSDFRELPEHLLDELGDERLLDYLRRARAAGRHDAMRTALAVLVFGYRDALVNRARLKLPSEADAQDVADEALASALVSAFDGRSAGELRKWLHVILSRRIADHWEARKRQVKTTALPSEHDGEEDSWGREPGTPFEGEALFAREALARAHEEVADARHRRVIDLYVFGPHSARETAGLVGGGMSEANVHQISSRYQKRVKELLDGSG